MPVEEEPNTLATTARIATIPNLEQSLGACIYLSVQDLRELGVSPDAQEVSYSIDSDTGQLEVCEFAGGTGNE